MQQRLRVADTVTGVLKVSWALAPCASTDKAALTASEHREKRNDMKKTHLTRLASPQDMVCRTWMGCVAGAECTAHAVRVAATPQHIRSSTFRPVSGLMRCLLRQLRPLPRARAPVV